MQRASGIFGLDPSIQELLKLSSFEDEFDIKDFVGSISENLIAQSKADSGPFDPKPFIRTFEASVDRLLAIRQELQKKTETLEQSLKTAEKGYSKTMSELNAGFETVSKSFSGMESKISEVGRTAIRIGEQLESVHISRQRAQAAYDLIDYYNQFSRGETTKIDALKKEGKDGRAQVAVILRRLITVAREVDIPTAEETRDIIDKYCEKFEKDMLKIFDRCYRKGEPKMMAHCAQVLLEFNGGSSCVQMYVNQHTFFISKSSMEDSAIDHQLWETVANPNTTPPKRETGIIALFTEIRKTVKDEARIVTAVFPNPSAVMQVFLQRVFLQSIQQYLERLVNKAQGLSTLAFLRVLHLSHIQVSSLVEDLKSYDATLHSSRNISSAADAASIINPVTLVGSSSSSGGTAVALGTMLETAMEELFMPYTEGTRYLDTESKSLGEHYSSYLFKFARYHEAVPKSKTSNLFGRVVNQLTTTSAGSSTTTAQAAQAFMKLSGFSAASMVQEKPKDGEDPVREEDGRLNVDVAERMLKWHAEAVGRCVELSAAGDVPKNSFALLRVLTDALGRSYIEAALETAQARVESRDPKLEPDLYPLTILRSVDMICHLWQQYVSTALLPLASSSMTVRREMVIFNNQTVTRIESLSNGLMQRMVDEVVAWLASQLQKQKKADFKPRNDDITLTVTEPCEACCDTLRKIRNVAKDNISGKNFEIFLTEVGVTFHGLLLDHLKKFPVSSAGGIKLANDLKGYLDAISTFNMPSLLERYEFLCQLGNIFVVPSDIVSSYISDDLGRIDRGLLRPYLMQRSDWNQLALAGLDAETVDGSAESEGSGKGLRERFGTMMRELDSLKTGYDELKPFSLPNFAVPSYY